MGHGVDQVARLAVEGNSRQVGDEVAQTLGLVEGLDWKLMHSAHFTVCICMCVLFNSTSTNR